MRKKYFFFVVTRWLWCSPSYVRKCVSTFWCTAKDFMRIPLVHARFISFHSISLMRIAALVFVTRIQFFFFSDVHFSASRSHWNEYDSKNEIAFSYLEWWKLRGDDDDDDELCTTIFHSLRFVGLIALAPFFFSYIIFCYRCSYFAFYSFIHLLALNLQLSGRCVQSARTNEHKTDVKTSNTSSLQSHTLIVSISFSITAIIIHNNSLRCGAAGQRICAHKTGTRDLNRS